MGYDFAERDLAHIGNVLGHLEHSADSVRAIEAGRWSASITGGAG